MFDCFRKKKLLILAGAGASVDFGMPSVNYINDLFVELADDYWPLVGMKGNIYSYIKGEVESHYLKNSSSLKKETNFEEILYVLEILSEYLLDENYFKNPVRSFVDMKGFPKINSFKRKVKEVDGNDLKFLSSHLLDGLLKKFRQECSLMPDNKKEELSILINFIKQLYKEFEIGVVTLNYDNVIGQCLKNPDTGFNKDSGMFEPTSVNRKKYWNFIYHMHGSIHFTMKGVPEDMHRIFWEDDFSKIKGSDSSGRNPQSTAEGHSYSTSSIIAGYGKTNKITRLPFITYYNALPALIDDADAFIFLGYGFGDMHINECFKNMLSLNDKRPILIVTHSDGNDDSIPHRYDDWCSDMLNCLHLEGRNWAQEGHVSPAVISELIKEFKFEVYNNDKRTVAIWYNGFLEACKSEKKMISFLKS